MNGTYIQRRKAQMAGGGIMMLPRRNYGLGSWVKERVRKIIPKEIAKVASKAAPFVAPFNPIAAGLMAGLGGFQQTGRVGQSLKSGLGTYGLGQAARYVGGAGVQKGFNPMGGMEGMKYGASVPWGTKTGVGEILSRSTAMDPTQMIPQLGSQTKKTSAFQQITDFVKAPFKELDEMGRAKAMLTVGAIGTGLSLVADKLVGKKDPGETIEEFNTRRKSTMSEYLRYYYKNVNPLASEEEVANFVATNTKEYKSQGGRIGYQMGGSLGVMPDWEPGQPAPEGWELMEAHGDQWIEPNFEGLMGPRGPMGPGMRGPMGLMGPMGMVPPNYMDPRGEPNISYITETGEPAEGPGPNIGRVVTYPEPQMGPGMMGPGMMGPMGPMVDSDRTSEIVAQQRTAGVPEEGLITNFAQTPPEGPSSVSMANTLAQNIEANKAQQQSTAGILEAGRARLLGNTGGRIGYALGNLDAGAQSIVYGGLPGTPQMASDGMEYDMSQNGGFQGLGAQEGKDDIKANLAKNEFVFTADAVRGAGDGDIETGAQRMYDTMKRLEGRVA